jgi:phage N-6-adenine-methyltransferase
MSKTGFSHESQHSVTKEWYTPQWIFEALDIEFDLDPCGPIDDVGCVPAKKKYTILDDGLKQPWVGTVWLNPPYGRSTTLWMAKMHEHRDGIALVFSRTDTAWFHDYAIHATLLLFLRKRIAFIDSRTGLETSGAGAGSLLCAWGEKAATALRKMNTFGFLTDGQH